MKSNLLNRLVTAVASFSLLLNSLGTPLLAFAQEVTPTPTPDATVEPAPTDTATPTDQPTSTPDATPTIEATATPTVTPDLTLTPDITPTPTVEITPTPTDEVTPSPTDEAVVSPAPETTPTTPGPPSDSTPTPDSTTPAPSPSATPEVPQEHGNISATLLHDTNASTVIESDLGLAPSDSSATLTTNKPDYAPTDAVVITGTGFIANKTYTIEITSSDAPAVDFKDQVEANDKGDIFYTYQLDGNYRPNYKVEVLSESVIVAATTFTDSASPALSWPLTWNTPGSCVTDLSGESGVSPSEVDLVGNVGTPAVGFNTDANYFYFRERINGNPGSASDLHNYSWVVLFQTSAPQYQYLGTITGKSPNGNQVRLYDNPTHSPDSGGVDFSPLFNDPADNIVWSGSSFDYGRVTGSGPYYIDWAIPISQLTSRGINTSTTKFFATSTNANNYNKDHLQCYDAFADLSIVKSDNPDPVVNGSTLTYTLAVHNGGPDAASGVIVTDTLPAEYSVTSVTPSQGSCSDTTAPSIQCELGSMANGANATVTIAGAMTGIGTVTNTASVNLDTTVSTDPNLSNNTDSEDTTINRSTGTLVVHKTFTDQYSNSGITINVSGAGSAQGTTNGSGDATFDNLTPGRYSATAVEPTGYYEFANTCSDVSVTAGNQTNCEITDSKILGTITVTKTVVGGTAIPSQFCFTLNPDPSIGEVCANTDGIATFNNVPYGTYDVDETKTVDGYSITSNNCSELGIVNNEDSKSCGITNTRDTGDLKAQKVVDDRSDLTLWSFKLDNGTFIPANSSGIVDFGQVSTLDDHTIVEDGPDGYHLVSITGTNCTQDGSTADAIVTKGGTTTCTFTNDRDTGAIVVYKDVQGPNGEDITDTSNSFSVQLGGANTESITDNGTVTYSDLPTGNYTITEFSVATGYTLYGISLTPGGSGNTGGLSVSVAYNQTTDVYVTNRQNSGTVIVVKTMLDPDGNPVDDTHSFTVNLNPGDQTDTFWQGHNAQFTVDPGTYTVTESSDADYAELGCQLPTGGTATNFSVAPGGTVTITCTNEQRTATITVEKAILDPDGNPVQDNHTFTVRVGGVEKPISEQTNAVYTVNPGNYTVSELGDSDYAELGCKLPNGDPATEFNIGSNGSITITCTNQQEKAHITVVKNVVGPDGQEVTDTSTDFVFNVSTQSADLTDGESQTFDVNPGTYDVTETPNSNYDFVGCEAVYGRQTIGTVIQNGVSVTLGSNDAVTVTCTNKQKTGTISGLKWNDLNDNGQRELEPTEPGLQGWEITAEEWSGETWNDPISTFTNGDGYYEFTDLNPGLYRICEVQQTGWVQTYPDGCYEEVVIGSNGSSTGNDFGNFSPNKEITISKSNDTAGTVGFGSTIIYTLVVTNTGNLDLNLVQVKDVLPGGFSYVDGSTVQTGGTLFNPPTVSGSTITWNVGTIDAGQSVTIVYKAMTGTDLSAGTYKNFATCKSYTGGLADLIDGGDHVLGDEVDCNVADSSVTLGAGQSYGGNLTPQVLGAATELPATGNDTGLLLFTIAAIIGGIAIRIYGKRKYGKN